jgi:5-hydroxyisourate hydrolase
VSPSGGGGLTTHVLDTAQGRPAAGLRVDLSIVNPDGRTRLLKTMTTNADGRCDAPLLTAGEMKIARYELVFHVAAYFRATGVTLSDPPFLEQVPVRFAIADPRGRYHVPLLVSPYGYVTYRGS